jgi:flagellar basal body rod protein FlgG
VNVGLYQAASALDANSRWQEVIADNLASGSMPGFKQSQLSMEAVQAGFTAANGAGNQNPAFTIPKGTASINFTPGELKYTGSNSDLAVDGKGFFNVRLPNGTVGLTRDGSFQINALGQLTTQEGYPVLGPDGPIQMDLENADPLSVSANGDISQGSETIGQFKLTDVNQPQLLTQISSAYFVAQNPSLLQKQSVSTLREGYLEESNSSAVGEMANLMTAMRGFEANQHVIQMEDDRMGKTITELGNPS